ncbi:MAG: T9SS type A sorting domain-containing protein [Bacteroidia bacterium]|nr:T9SS type A sorting domain-containing protein [Bacteroidia bacterium]
MRFITQIFLLLVLLLIGQINLAHAQINVIDSGFTVDTVITGITDPTELTVRTDSFQLFWTRLYKYTGYLYTLDSNYNQVNITTDFTPDYCGCNYPYGFTDIQYTRGKVYTMNNYGNLTQIDVKTAYDTVLHTYNFFSIEAGMDVKNDSLLYFTDGTGLAREMWEYNLNTHQTKMVMPNLPSRTTGLEYDPVNDLIFFIDHEFGRMYKADLKLGTYTQLNALNGAGNLAVDPQGKYLYSRHDNWILKNDIQTGQFSVFTLGISMGKYQDIEFGPSRSGNGISLYAISGNTIIEISGFSGCLNPDPTYQDNSSIIDEGCPGAINGSVALNPAGPVGPFTYSWSNGDSTQAITNVKSGTYDVVVRDENKCPYFASYDVKTSASPVVTLGQDTLICEGESLVVSPAETFATFLWNDSSTSSSIVVDSGGTYWVTASDTAGCTGYDTIVVVQNPPIWLDLGNDTILCYGDVLTRSAPPGFSSYLWSTGNTQNSQQITQAGNYAVQVWDQAGCNEADTVQVDYLNQLANPNISSVGPATLCINDTLDLLSDPGFVSYLWSTGDVSQNSQTTSGGQISLMVTDTNGCTRTEYLQVNYLPYPDPNPVIMPMGDVDICQGTSIILDPGSGYVAYEWNSGQVTQTISVSNSGAYQVLAYNGFGCSEYSNVVNVNVLTVPSPVITINGNQLTSSPGAFYQWSFGGNPIPGAILPNLTATQSGLYAVAVTDTNGCRAESDTLVTLVSKDGEVLENVIAIYPNPARDFVSVELSIQNSGPVSFEIDDLLGRRVEQGMLDSFSRKQLLNVSGLNRGLYLIKVFANGKEYSGRIILE